MRTLGLRGCNRFIESDETAGEGRRRPGSSSSASSAKSKVPVTTLPIPVCALVPPPLTQGRLWPGTLNVPPQRMPSSSGEGAQFANWAGGERAHHRYSILDPSAPVFALGQPPYKRGPCPAGDDGRGGCSTGSAVSAPFVPSVRTGATFPDAGKAKAYKEIHTPWHSRKPQ